MYIFIHRKILLIIVEVDIILVLLNKIKIIRRDNHFLFTCNINCHMDNHLNLPPKKIYSKITNENLNKIIAYLPESTYHNIKVKNEFKPA